MTEFQINKDKDKDKAGSVKYKYFCMRGKHTFENKDGQPCLEDDSINALAKEVYSTLTDTCQYFVKFDRRNNLFDPYGMDGVVSNRTTRLILQKYKKVSRATFELYLKYLNTRNKAYLHNAQRSLQ